MIVKSMKSNLLILNYNFLSEEGRSLNKRQSFDFLPLDAADDDLYSMGKAIGDSLIAMPKSIEKSTAFILTEG